MESKTGLMATNLKESTKIIKKAKESSQKKMGPSTLELLKEASMMDSGK